RQHIIRDSLAEFARISGCAIDKKNPQTKIGRELLIRVHLLIYSPPRQHIIRDSLAEFARISGCAIDKKNPKPKLVGS
ncbi:hypothetical protein QUB64_14085, partial [Microcoleus sp. Aus8_D2]|uniref:hypothetical protein n=1 Tax=Microcoleus sp. Aus8_D2 TaxID=2818632 RepID=UPI002FD091FF